MSKIVHGDAKRVSLKLFGIDLIYADILYDQWESVPYQELIDCLRLGGMLCVQTDQRSVAQIKLLLDANPKLNFVNWIIWSYDWGGRPKDAFGHKHDDILCYSRGTFQRTFNARAVAIPKVALINSKKAWKIPTDVWQGNFYTTSAERIKDPETGKGFVWQKPEWLLERLIKAFTNKGHTVFEPYLGTGTACAVAKKLGRSYIGCDTNARMVKVAKARLEGL